MRANRGTIPVLAGRTLTWSVTDAESAISSQTGCEAVDVTSDQDSTTYTCSATSAGGSATDSVTIKRDATPPHVTLTGVEDGVVYGADAVPQAGCVTQDATSGVATDATLTIVPGSNGRVTATCSGAKDNAGNTAADVSATYMIDSTPPAIEPTIVGTLGDNGWYTGDVHLTWTVTDNESPISSQTGCDAVDVTSDQQSTTYTCTATSAGGSVTESVSIKRDATPPDVAVTGVQAGAIYELGTVPVAGCEPGTTCPVSQLPRP